MNSPPPPPGTGAAGGYRLLKTRDGYAIGLLLMPNQRIAFCEALGRPDLKPTAHGPTLYDDVAEDVGKLTTAEFMDKMRKHQVPFAPVNDIEAFFEDPQVKHNQTYFDMDHPEYGRMRNFTFMAEYAATPAGLRTVAPKLGEHTAEVLAEYGVSTAPARDGVA